MGKKIKKASKDKTSSLWKGYGGSCWASHKPLKLVSSTGKEYEILGGCCTQNNSAKESADIVVGLDWGMEFTPRSYPWHPEHRIEMLYKITDMTAPKDPESFKQLILWLKNQITRGKKVFIGCIGGHGRTGTVLSALVSEFMHKEDAITYVRENYCSKAVETSSQIEFLHKHFGIKKVPGSKANVSHYGTGGSYGYGYGSGYSGSKSTSNTVPLGSYSPDASLYDGKRFTPIKDSLNRIW